MNQTLSEKYKDLIKNNFGEWLDEMERNWDNPGESLAKVWNQYSEDKCLDSIYLLDLEDKDDFGTLFIDGRYIEIARETGLPPKEKRWAMVDNTQNDVIRKEDYKFYDYIELQQLCLSESASIFECVLAWPSLYPRELYEAIVWPVLIKENLVDLDL